MLRLLSALLVSLALGLGGLYLVAPEAFSRESLGMIDGLDAGWAIAILAPVVAWWLLSAWRLTFLTVRSSRRLSLWQATQTHIVGTLSAVATPAGGGNSIGIVFLLNRFGLPANQAVAVAVMCLVGDLAFFAWAAPLGYFLLRAAGVSMPLQGLGFLVTIVALLALAVSYLLVFRLPIATRLIELLARLPFLRRFRVRFETFLRDLDLASKVYAQRPWHWHLRFHLLSAGARLPYFAVLNLILIGLTSRADHLVVYAAQIVLHAFAFLIPTPGASGFQEGAMTAALRGHVTGASIAAAVMLWRIYQHYLYFLVGPLAGGLALIRRGRHRAPVNGHGAGKL